MAASRGASPVDLDLGIYLPSLCLAWNVGVVVETGPPLLLWPCCAYVQAQTMNVVAPCLEMVLTLIQGILAIHQNQEGLPGQAILYVAARSCHSFYERYHHPHQKLIDPS